MNMLIWKQTYKSPQLHKCETSFGNLVVSSNWVKHKRIRTGHKIKMKRWGSASGEFVNAPTQGDGYLSTAGYKYTGEFGVGKHRKTFYGNNIEMVKKLVENHYRLLLKNAIHQFITVPIHSPE